MIVSKPKFNSVFAISVFLIICFTLGFINLRIAIQSRPEWYNYLIIAVTLPVALAILIKQFRSIKIITVGSGTFKVAHPLILRAYEFKLKEIAYWEEVEINTKGSKFKELSIRLESGNSLKLNVQENSNYHQVRDHLVKKVPRKQKELTS